jgi:hypothetical protein
MELAGPAGSAHLTAVGGAIRASLPRGDNIDLYLNRILEHSRARIPQRDPMGGRAASALLPTARRPDRC